MSEYVIRQKSARGQPRPTSEFERRCKTCGASFLQLSPGRTGEAGVWVDDWVWVCSRECEKVRKVGSL